MALCPTKWPTEALRPLLASFNEQVRLSQVRSSTEVKWKVSPPEPPIARRLLSDLETKTKRTTVKKVNVFWWMFILLALNFLFGCYNSTCFLLNDFVELIRIFCRRQEDVCKFLYEQLLSVGNSFHRVTSAFPKKIPTCLWVLLITKCPKMTQFIAFWEHPHVSHHSAMKGSEQGVLNHRQSENDAGMTHLHVQLFSSQ